MSGWVWVVLAMGIVWAFSARKMQRKLQQYQTENRRLRESSGGLESSLANSGHRLDSLLSAVNEAVLRLDRDGRVLAANDWAREVFAISDQIIFPQALLMFYRDPDWHQAFMKGLENLPQATSLPNMTPDARVLSPRLAQLGRDQALLLCMDITEQHRLEGQRRTFLSNLMHDLKTPLTSLLGYARSLDTFGEDPDFRKEAAQVIADEAKHVNHLLDALLTLDQIEFSARDPEASCDARVVLQSVCDALKPQLTDKASHIKSMMTDELPKVAIHADDLERVLTNIIENAIRYAPAKSHIRVQMEQEGDNILIAIEDQGEGVPEKELPRLTERFYRVDKARARKEGGHGLGLAIVQELVSIHEGRLHFANIEPHGLRVEILLPQKD